MNALELEPDEEVEDEPVPVPAPVPVPVDDVELLDEVPPLLATLSPTVPFTVWIVPLAGAVSVV